MTCKVPSRLQVLLTSVKLYSTKSQWNAPDFALVVLKKTRSFSQRTAGLRTDILTWLSMVQNWNEIGMTLFNLLSRWKGKAKSLPVTGRGSPYAYETWRLPHFLDNRLTDGMRLSALSAGCPLAPERCLVLISVEAESTPGPYCGWKY
jgi:hypothetical protein